MQRQKIYPEGTLFQEALSGCVSRKLGKKPNIRKTGVWEETVAMQESRDRKSHLVVCATGGESTVPSVELGIGSQGQKSRERKYFPQLGLPQQKTPQALLLKQKFIFPHFDGQVSMIKPAVILVSGQDIPCVYVCVCVHVHVCVCVYFRFF